MDRILAVCRRRDFGYRAYSCGIGGTRSVDALSALSGRELYVVDAVCARRERCESYRYVIGLTCQREVAHRLRPVVVCALGFERVVERRRPRAAAVEAYLNVEILLAEAVVLGLHVVAHGAESETKVALRTYVDLVDRHVCHARAEQNEVAARAGIVRVLAVRRLVRARRDALYLVFERRYAGALLVFPALPLIAVGPRSVDLLYYLLVEVVVVERSGLGRLVADECRHIVYRARHELRVALVYGHYARQRTRSFGSYVLADECRRRVLYE